MKRSEIQTLFYQEKGMEAVSEKGEFQSSYVNFIEDKLTNSEKMNELLRNFIRTNHLTSKWEEFLKNAE